MTAGMTITEINPGTDCSQWLAGAQFADAFRATIVGTTIDARGAAMRMFSRPPGWIETLLTLRNLLVAPFGLKGSGASDKGKLGMIGMFPVISETPERLVAGFNDSHLDFRVVIDIASVSNSQQVTATTLVKTHNWLGRTYLATIMPFHRMVVKSLLRQLISS